MLTVFGIRIGPRAGARIGEGARAGAEAAIGATKATGAGAGAGAGRIFKVRKRGAGGAGIKL